MASIKLSGNTSGEITISSPDVAGTHTLTLPSATETLATQNSLGVRNLIINGDMRIAQRGTSVTGITGSGYNTCDRWRIGISAAGTWTQSQSTDVPTGQGFANSLKMDCTTADASLSSGDQLTIHHRLEGQMLQHLKKGTSSAEKVTLSFWVKSNKTGTYTAELYDSDNIRQVSKTYTIDTADTWEKKTITYDGDISGALDNDNNNSLGLYMWLLAGTGFTSGTLNTDWDTSTTANRVSSSQVNLADSTSNYINITGVQLEVGTEATPFEHRPYDMELARCQRYYYVLAEGDNQAIAVGYYYNATILGLVGTHPVQMRATPTVDQTTGTNYYSLSRNNSQDTFNSFTVAGATNNKNYNLFNNTEVSGTAGQAGLVYSYTVSGGNAYVALSAEL